MHGARHAQSSLSTVPLAVKTLTNRVARVNERAMPKHFILSPLEVARIRIDRMTPGSASARISVESGDAAIVQRFVNAVELTPRMRGDTVGTVRFTIRLQDTRGRTLRRLDLDASGTRGILDAFIVRFKRDAVLRAIAATFPGLTA